MADNKNYILAIALSIIVLVAWQYFYGIPQMERQREQAAQQQAAQQQAAQPQATPQAGAPAPAAGTAPQAPVATAPDGRPMPAPATPAAPVGGAPAPVLTGMATRDALLAQSPRVAIDTPRLKGSIALRGGRLDDLSLLRYRETLAKDSPNIVLLSPSGTPAVPANFRDNHENRGPFYAEIGFVPGAGQQLQLPGPNTVWTQEGANRLTPTTPVTLTFDNGQGLVFRRVISVDDKYMFAVEDSVSNRGAAAVTLHPYALISRHGQIGTHGFFILHEGLIGVFGQAGLQQYTYHDIEKGNQTWQATGGWAGITDKYWAAAIVPDQTQRLTAGFRTFAGTVRSYQTDFLLDARTLAPGETTSATTRIFAGAKEVVTIEGYEDAYKIDRFDLFIDWGWFYFITEPMFYVLDFFFKFTGNFGVAILIITVVLKLLFFPLANKSYASMAKMKAVQPKMTEIRERYADDKMKQQQLLMELYQKEKINPLAGCLPILIQIPVFFALYKILFISIEMRHAPFFGWVQDLAAPDPTSIFNLFGLLPFAVPHFLLVGIWPIIMGITMFVQMKMNPDPPDQIQKMIFTWMPLLFTFMLATFPAGLVIYWAWNNALSIAQQWYIMQKHGVKVELFDNIKGMFSKKQPST